MTPQECLKKICKVKSASIKRIIGPPALTLFWLTDYLEISTWSNVKCEEIIDRIYSHITNNNPTNDHHICPWCVVYNKNSLHGGCGECVYGKRHGVCGDTNSIYTKIIKKLQGCSINAICNVPNLLFSIITIIDTYKFQDNSKTETNVDNSIIETNKEVSMKIFHLNDINKTHGSKKQGFYHSKKEFFGHIVTNKATRNNERYAYKFESKGRWCSTLSKEDFQWFKNKCEHIYIKTVNEEKMEEILSSINDMTREQIKRMMKSINQRFNKTFGNTF